MKKDTLYLHVGWSKTGTSAIQAQIQQQREDFLQQGILYPQSLQWPDHSHHPFALAFQGCGSYQGDMSPKEVLEKLSLEMQATQAPHILLSSELSPFYFNNPRFKNFTETHFSRVVILFTIRLQSELLLSLFNQLIKDSNVRYPASLFTLAMRNITWLHFRQNILRWLDIVGQKNIAVIPYGTDVVERFFDYFGVAAQSGPENTFSIVNPSLPTRCLALLQKKGQSSQTPAEYARIRDEIINMATTISIEHDRYALFSVAEQQAHDDYYKGSNLRLAEMFQFDPSLLTKVEYTPINVLPPDFVLDTIDKSPS